MKIDKKILQEKCEKLGCAIEFEERKKENRTLTGIMFQFMRKKDEEGKSACPIFYLENEEIYFDGNYEKLILSLLERAKAVQDTYVLPKSFDFIEKWDFAKNNIRASLRSNIKELEDLVCIPCLNLYMIFYINIPLSEENFGMAKISKEVFEKWNVSMEDLLCAAIANSSDFCVYVSNENETPYTAKQLSLSNVLDDEGSIALAHPAMIKLMANQFDCNFIIAAPSVHRIELFKTDKEELTMSDIFFLMTKVQSAMESIPKDLQLTNSVYFYNRKSEQIILCD